MFYTKQYFWIELFLEFTPKKKKKAFYERSHCLRPNVHTIHPKFYVIVVIFNII